MLSFVLVLVLIISVLICLLVRLCIINKLTNLLKIIQIYILILLNCKVGAVIQSENDQPNTWPQTYLDTRKCLVYADCLLERLVF